MGMFDDLIPSQTANLNGTPPSQRLGVMPMQTRQQMASPQAGGMFDDLIPPQVPGGLNGEIIPPPQAATVQEPRLGDFMKPAFGGHNPIADVYDVAAPALDPSSNRPILERAQDTANFVASAPLQALRLPSFGQMAESAFGDSTLKNSEERFVENNPDLLRGLGAVGEVAPGMGPMGQGFRMPPRPQQPPAKPRIEAQVSDDVQRARASADDMRQIGVEPYGPAVAAAKRGDNSGGAVTQALQDKPVIGTPLQRGARRFVDDLGTAQENIRQGYGQSQTMQGAGGQIRSGLDEFKNSRRVDVTELPPAELERLAASPPRLSTFKDVQSAKYHRAERFLPEDKGKAQPVAKGEERVIGGLENTRSVLRAIKRRYGLTINKAEAARRTKASADDISLENTADFANPRWTGSPNIDASMNAIAAKGPWNVGIEGMREIRSSIRRVMSSKADTEVNALGRGDLKRLYSAVSKDMDALLMRKAEQARKMQDGALARRYEQALEAYKDADRFTANYAGRMEEAKGLFRVQSDEAMAGAIKSAMQDGTKGNLQRLVSLRKILPKEAIDEMASALILDLGKPTGRAGAAAQEAGFSPSMFAAKWNELSPRGRRIMFGHRPKLYEALERFARVSQNVADFEKLANSSRSGVSNFVSGILAGGSASLAMLSPQALVGLVGTILAGRSASAFLASPAYVNWLTRATALSRNGSPEMISSHIRSLKRLVADNAALDPQTAQAIALAVSNAGGEQNGKQ